MRSRRQTDGAVEITVKAGGQLGFKGPEHLRAVRDGLVPMADMLNIQQVGDEPLLGIEGIPFLAVSMDELKVLHKYVRPEYDKIAEQATTRRSSTSCPGRRSIFTSR